jgi:hypothetical protein
MVSLLCPVETGVGEAPPLGARSGQIDAELFDQLDADPSEREAAATAPKGSPRKQALSKCHAEPAGKMVVTRASGAQTSGLGAANVYRLPLGCQCREGLDGMSDLRPQQPITALPPRSLHGDQARVDQLRQMATRG